MNSLDRTVACGVLVALLGCSRTHLESSVEGRNASIPALARAGAAARASEGGRDADISQAASGHAGMNSLPAAHGGGNSAEGAGHKTDAGRDGLSGRSAVTGSQAAGTAGGGPSSAQAGNSAPADGRSEVWIGELWSIDPILCDKIGRTLGDPIITDVSGDAERVVLILEYDARDKLGGRVQFGQATVPADPSAWAYADPNMGTNDENRFWRCTTYYPASGAEYTLLNPIRTADRLMFEVASAEVWDAWCRTQDRPSQNCVCSDTSCQANKAQHVAIDLATTVAGLEGVLSTGSNEPTDVRLRRVQ